MWLKKRRHSRPECKKTTRVSQDWYADAWQRAIVLDRVAFLKELEIFAVNDEAELFTYPGLGEPDMVCQPTMCRVDLVIPK